MILNRCFRAVLPHLPEPLLVRTLLSRPYLLESLPNGTQFVYPYRGLRAHVEIGNVIEEEIVKYGEYDTESCSTIRHFVKPSMVCMDVGANVGLLSMLMAQLGASVYAFEPGPPYVERMQANLRLNPELESRVTIEQLGLADKPGTLFWAADPTATYNAALNASAGVSVPVTTVDDYAKSMPQLDLIKIDVESMELEVLKGAQATLRRLRPTVYFESMEWARKFRGFDVFAEIEALLNDAGYAMYDLIDGKLVRVHANSLPLNTIARPA
jgi:FkbM family methyltransferase